MNILVSPGSWVPGSIISGYAGSISSIIANNRRTGIDGWLLSCGPVLPRFNMCMNHLRCGSNADSGSADPRWRLRLHF